MTRMAKHMPDVTLRIAGATDRVAASMLETGQIDVALQFADWLKGGTPLVWDSVVLVAPVTSKAADTIRFRDLEYESLLLPFVGSPLRRKVEDIATQVGIRLNVVAEIEGTGSRKEAVLGGLGSTLGSWHSVERECKAGWLGAREIVDPPVRRLFVLKHREGIDPRITATLQTAIVSLLLGPHSHLAAGDTWQVAEGQ
jgi:DNA-binding transcriptional LysR family regulator